MRSSAGRWEGGGGEKPSFSLLWRTSSRQRHINWPCWSMTSILNPPNIYFSFSDVALTRQPTLYIPHSRQVYEFNITDLIKPARLRQILSRQSPFTSTISQRKNCVWLEHQFLPGLQFAEISRERPYANGSKFISYYWIPLFIHTSSLMWRRGISHFNLYENLAAQTDGIFGLTLAEVSPHVKIRKQSSVGKSSLGLGGLVATAISYRRLLTPPSTKSSIMIIIWVILLARCLGGNSLWISTPTFLHM